MSVKRIKNLVKQLNEYRHATTIRMPLWYLMPSMTDSLDELKELEEQNWFHPVKFSDTDGWILSGQ